MALIPMQVETVTFDFPTLTPVVILVSKDKKQMLPLWTDIHNAYSIMKVLDKTEELRPSAHALLASILGNCSLPFKVEIYKTTTMKVLKEAIGGYTAECPKCNSKQVSRLNDVGCSSGEVYACETCGATFSLEFQNKLVYIANIIITKDKKEIKVDARPTDAITMATIAGANIFVDSSLLEKAEGLETKEISKEEIDKMLEKLSPSDFGTDSKQKPN